MRTGFLFYITLRGNTKKYFIKFKIKIRFLLLLIKTQTMHIEAIFSNIAIRILNEIETAEQSVYIAVAWFTNKLIFDKLLLKVKNGCKVYIIISNDKINENSQIDFELLEKFNGKIYKIGDVK